MTRGTRACAAAMLLLLLQASAACGPDEYCNLSAHVNEINIYWDEQIPDYNLAVVYEGDAYEVACTDCVAEACVNTELINQGKGFARIHCESEQEAIVRFSSAEKLPAELEIVVEGADATIAARKQIEWTEYSYEERCGIGEYTGHANVSLEDAGAPTQ